MKKKFLSKMMMVALVFCSMFFISACSNLQKDVNIKSIEIVQSSVPLIIRVGEFDDAKIQMIVTYEDSSSEKIYVTSSMIPQKHLSCLETPGIYEIEIFFKGEKASLNVTIVEAATYLVEFYNGKEQLIERQYVTEGEDAVAPSENAYSMFGYEFIGWDRLFTDVSEDIKVYGVYSKLTTEDMNALVHEKMKNAFAYTYSNNYVMNMVGQDAQLSYHFDDKENKGYSQTKMFMEGELSYLINMTSDTIYSYSYDKESKAWKLYVEDLTDEDNKDMSEEERKLAAMFGSSFISILFDETTEWSYSYHLTENRNIYNVDAVFVSESDTEKLSFVFDDEKILSFKYEKYTNESSSSEAEISNNMLFDYKTEEFISIEDKTFFLATYNKARANTLAKTTLRYEEIEEGDGYYIVTNIANNKIYEYSTHNEEESGQRWIQKEQDVWYCYSQESNFNQKFEVSDAIIDDNLVQYVSDGQLVEFDSNVVAMVDCFECCFENGYTKLIITIFEDEYEMQMIYYIEKGLITKMEEIMPGEPKMTWLISYNPEDVEMVELPTDIEWTEN